MTGTAAVLRTAFADALVQVGESAPTLCGGWTAADLAAHVYVREHRLDATPGVLPLGPWSAYTERVMRSVLRVHGFAWIVEELRTPPLWLRPDRLDAAANTVELYVHTEDVRRANGLAVRSLPEDLERRLWRRLSRQARVSFRRVDAAVTLVPTIGDPVRVGRGNAEVHVRGLPSELILLAYNRKDVAQVEIDGPGADALRTAKLGI